MATFAALNTFSRDFIKKNFSLVRNLSIGLSLYTIYKLYSKWKYNQLEFTSDLHLKVILITGCDTGFGNALAYKLDNIGYTVVATCLFQESVTKFKNDPKYSKKSFALIMDVMKDDSILNAKEELKNILNKNNQYIFWGLVNNAGFAIPGSFEMVPKEFAAREYGCLFFGQINVTRAFLPLIYGRKNNIHVQNDNHRYCDGGRIINVSSAARSAPQGGMCRYGVSKSAVTYFSHCLRFELGTRFGIWCAPVEPGAFNTNIFNVGKKQLAACVEYYKASKNQEEKAILDLYQMEKFETYYNEFIEKRMKPMMTDDLSECVDAIIHGLTAKYPQREYAPNLGILRIFFLLPESIKDRFFFNATKQGMKMGK